MENNRSFYNEILTDHNLHPMHKHELADANMQLEGVNPSCGDDIILNLKVEDGKIVDGSFTGDGCAISQASADIMLDLIIGREVEEAERLKESFLHMIKGEATDEEMEKLVHLPIFPICLPVSNVRCLAGIHWRICWMAGQKRKKRKKFAHICFS